MSYPAPVLVTGVSGFLAGHLARALAADGAAVVGASRRPPPHPDVRAACRWEALDLLDFAATQALVEREQPQIVYHLAATAFLHAAVTDGPRAMIAANAGATANVLEACRRAGTPAVVAASSDKQYGALAVPPYDDEDTTALLNGGVYELSKFQGDQIARLYAGLYDAPRVRVARLVNLYGTHDEQWTRIVPGNIARVFRGERPRVTAGRAGEALREYLHVDDATRALRLLADDALARGNAPLRRPDGKLARVAFNVPSPHRYAAAGVIGAIRDVLREDHGITGPEPETLPGTPGVFEPGSQFTDPSKFTALAGGQWAPAPLRDGLRRTVPWYLERLRAQG